MLSFSSIILLASVSTTFALSPLVGRTPKGCNADNCLRAVTGTAVTQTRADRTGDCSSFMGALGIVSTVTPPTVTVTTTASFVDTATLSFFTTTTTTLAPGEVVKRDATPSVPAYASPCSGTARYSSACSCWGITASTTTAPTPTATVTASTTYTTTTVDVTSTSTSYAVYPTCQPLTCGSFQGCNGYDVSENEAGGCYCFSDANGVGFCADNFLCSGTPCASDADCSKDGSLGRCAINTCCSPPSNAQPGICTVASEATCDNPNLNAFKRLSKMMMMKRGSVSTGAWKAGMLGHPS